MSKTEKTLHGDLDIISRKIENGMIAALPNVVKRETWDTKAGDIRCIFTVYENVARKEWTGSEFKDAPHYSLSLTLIDTGEEIRLCAITSGCNQGLYFIPGDGAEGALVAALNTALEIMDDIP